MEQLKITDFDADDNLLYLIQQTSKQSSAEILAYFYSTATDIVRLSLVKSTASRPQRRLTTFYPGTSIPFTLQVYCWNSQSPGVTPVSCCVNFPKKVARRQCNELAKLMNELAEAQILGHEPPKIEAFKEPMHKAPTGMRNLKNIKMAHS